MDPASLEGLRSLGAAAERNDAGALQKVAREFEALLVGEMMKQASKPLLEEGMLSGGSAGRMWNEMFLDQIVREGGGSFGLAEAVERELGVASSGAEEGK
ncbi:MAG: hypothetical protein GY723_04605 [bacterium]|nr:hypothetical protein [bacterium]MCP5067374.1 hypothetical protein [bacterium]